MLSQANELARTAVRPLIREDFSLAGVVSWLRSKRPLLLILVQLGLVLFVASEFAIEESFGFNEILPLIFGGFVVHALLPLRLRLPFFLLLSLGAIVTILGLKQGGALILVGMGLIAMCHLPIRFAFRVGLLVTAGIGLAVVRSGWIETSWESLPTIIVPILGAMFMFRLIVYLYDLRHERKPASIWERLTYFFMLPNVCFLLFPVVDYQTFRRTYYDSEDALIYQKGLLWITRGILHLVFYRLIYLHILPSGADVHNLGSLIVFMLATYGLYLRISGLFHLVIGVMCLFGFNLPETHHLYYLASSFTDYWRRINIYWKDFMVKIFYYPSLMRIRKWGMTTALVASTFIVFIATWLLHSYQWFWLQGTFPMTGPDALFWGILGTLVVANTLIEARRPRKSVAKNESWSFGRALRHSLKVLGMFVFICTLWSLWSSETVGEWVRLMSQTGGSSLTSWLILGLVLAALVGIGVLAQYLLSRGWNLSLAGRGASPRASAAYVGCVGLFLLTATSPRVHDQIGEEPSALLASIQTEKLNEQDLAEVERGYYEGLLDGGGFQAAMRKMQGLPEIEPFDESAGVVGTGDVLIKVMKPSTSFDYSGVTMKTNQWGMRDKEYSKVKPDGTFRIALAGASHVMGNGVENDETFESLVETRLAAMDSSDVKVELMNFAVTGFGPVQVGYFVQTRIAPFQPDVVLFFAHADQVERAVDKFGWAVYRGEEIPASELSDIVRKSNVQPRISRHTITKRLSEYSEDLLRWSYKAVVDASLEMGAVPVWVHLPWVHEEPDPNRLSYLQNLARDAGFEIMSLDGAYAAVDDRQSLQVAPWDTHPNAEGHRLLADRLYEELITNAELLGLEGTESSFQIPP